jgi:hypothetical protein
VWRIIPPANPFQNTGWTFTNVTPSGLVAAQEKGSYSKFRWAPYPHDRSRGVFAVYQGWTADLYQVTNVYVWKPNF